uniref:Uncharacterized protein n=1 Tax=Oryza sativa subsp. japonica TaxID=39947 RepID=Q6ZAY2_ORYSJ|nr:hypothetical protein [Oryza sativa Japonica Group]
MGQRTNCGQSNLIVVLPRECGRFASSVVPNRNFFSHHFPSVAARCATPRLLLAYNSVGTSEIGVPLLSRTHALARLCYARVCATPTNQLPPMDKYVEHQRADRLTIRWSNFNRCWY